ncbi:MAG: cation diffusion facilitator family transporter [Elainella sp.]
MDETDLRNRACCVYHQGFQPNPQAVRSLWIALLLLVGAAGLELGLGLMSHSLSLVAESGHLLADGLALGLSLLAAWLAQLPSSQSATFGYRRVEILAALGNSVALLIVAGWIGWEALVHLAGSGEQILSEPMLIAAILGLAVNGVNLRLLHQDSQWDLNLRGAWLHLLADLLSSLGVLAAALLIWLWGWSWADGAISLGVAVLIGATAIPLLRQSLHVLLEKTPLHLDADQIQQDILAFDGVVAVQTLRLWTIALGQEAISAQITVSFLEGSRRDRLLQALQTHFQQAGFSEIFLQLSAGQPLDRLVSLTTLLDQPTDSLLVGKIDSDETT